MSTAVPPALTTSMNSPPVADPTSLARISLMIICPGDGGAARVVAEAVALSPETFPAASCARTRYQYVVLAASPVLDQLVCVVVATLVKVAPSVLRSTWYPVTPTLSVEALHVRLICEFDAAVAARLAGMVGAWVSGASVVAEAVLLTAYSLPAASIAAT